MRIWTLILVLLLAGCGKDDEIRLDGSSDSGMTHTLIKMRDSLPEGKREEFAEVYIWLSECAEANGQREMVFYESLHGKTADEVIEFAQKKGWGTIKVYRRKR